MFVSRLVVLYHTYKPMLFASSYPNILDRYLTCFFNRHSPGSNKLVQTRLNSLYGFIVSSVHLTTCFFQLCLELLDVVYLNILLRPFNRLIVRSRSFEQPSQILDLIVAKIFQ